MAGPVGVKVLNSYEESMQASARTQAAADAQEAEKKEPVSEEKEDGRLEQMQECTKLQTVKKSKE